MKRVRATVIFLTVQMSVIGSAYANSNAVREACADQWPGDYRMQKYCFDRAAKEASDVIDFLERYGMTVDDWTEHMGRGEVPALILDRCMQDFRDDSEMLAHCLSEEEKAAISLGKIGGSPEKAIEFVPGVYGDLAAINAMSDYLKRHEFKTITEASDAAKNGNKAGLIFVECRSKDYRKQAKCLLSHEAKELSD